MMWNKLQRLFVHHHDSVVGVDVGTGSVKMAELDWPAGQPRLRSARLASLPPGTMDNGYCQDVSALAAALRQAADAGGVKARDAVLGIGAPGLFLREAVYPVMSLPELAQAVKWDSEQHVTLEPGSYYLDFAVTGQGELGLKVLLAASPRETVDRLVAAARDAGLRPLAVDAEPLALYRTLTGAENSLVLDIGAALSTITLFQGGVPVVTRAVPVGGDRFTETVGAVFELGPAEAERFKQRQKGLLRHDGEDGERGAIGQQLGAVVAELVRQAAQTTRYFGSQNKNAVVDKVILTGGGARLDNLAPFFAAQFDTPVVVHDPLAAVAVDPRLDPQQARAAAGQFGVAVGLALGGGGAS